MSYSYGMFRYMTGVYPLFAGNMAFGDSPDIFSMPQRTKAQRGVKRGVRTSKKSAVKKEKPRQGRVFQSSKIVPKKSQPQVKHEVERVRKMTKKGPLQSVRGMRDILPHDFRYWRWFKDTARTISEQYGYQEIELPIVEDVSLFKRSIGDVTDVVQKEMYEFTDAGGDHLALRPEATAGIVRAYIEHGMLNLPQPLKLFTMGPMFRYDRPQSGRYRQFYQFDIEVIGSDAAVIDAEVIVVAYTLLKELGIESTIHVNSLGSSESRVQYKKVLQAYLKSRKNNLCDDCQERFSKNVLRVLDCKNEQCQQAIIDAPELVDYLDDDSQKHFVSVLEHLDAVDLPYVLNPHIVRGLDYYNKTAFEFFATDQETGRQSAFGGGGRYDSLMEQLGGRPTPACGLALGIDRVIAAMRDKKSEPPTKEAPAVYLAQIGDQARKRALQLFERLRKAGIPIAGNLAKDGLRQQLELADKKGARFAVILGQKEMIDGTVLIRDMESGMQETVDFKKIEKELEKRLKK